MNDWLIELDGLSEADREEARDCEDDQELVKWLVGSGLTTPQKILRAKSKFYELPSISLSGYHVSPEALELISEEQARKLCVMPLFCRGKLLFVALSDPFDLRCEDFLRKLTSKRVKPVLADPDDIVSSVTRKYLAVKVGVTFEPTLNLSEKNLLTADMVEANIVEASSPAAKEVSKIISQAIRLGASDIHLEPDGPQVYLRYRVDGILHEYSAPTLEHYPSLVSRIKIISNLDIAEKRLPQDGRASLEVDGKPYDLRINVLPNVHGEGVCIRILNPESTKMTLQQMGFEEDTLERFVKVISRPHGIVLVTGPTGSGKSTTLYATLQRISSREIKIITIEDPVEYKISGLVQIPVKSNIGYTFGMGLKAILRHDPDVVMLGEIRDLESAEIAFQAALTGHLLFSTLHTNSAALAITRLLDMGVQPFQVMAALSGVLAQRLLRRLCSKCKAPRTLSLGEIRNLGLDDSVVYYKIYRPMGCPSCQNIGYKGRTAIHEFIEITPPIKALKVEELTDSNIEELARPQGFRTLREAAIRKLLDGTTSLEEVLAVT
jgi:type IV pilus assembly protein PilB